MPLARAVRVRLEVLRGEGEAEDESEGVRVAVDAGGVQGRPPLHRQHRDQEREAPQEQLHDLEGEVDALKTNISIGLGISYNYLESH